MQYFDKTKGNGTVLKSVSLRPKVRTSLGITKFINIYMIKTSIKIPIEGSNSFNERRQSHNQICVENIFVSGFVVLLF